MFCAIQILDIPGGLESETPHNPCQPFRLGKQNNSQIDLHDDCGLMVMHLRDAVLSLRAPPPPRHTFSLTGTIRINFLYLVCFCFIVLHQERSANRYRPPLTLATHSAPTTLPRIQLITMGHWPQYWHYKHPSARLMQNSMCFQSQLVKYLLKALYNWKQA